MFLGLDLEHPADDETQLKLSQVCEIVTAKATSEIVLRKIMNSLGMIGSEATRNKIAHENTES